MYRLRKKNQLEFWKKKVKVKTLALYFFFSYVRLVETLETDGQASADQLTISCVS